MVKAEFSTLENNYGHIQRCSLTPSCWCFSSHYNSQELNNFAERFFTEKKIEVLFAIFDVVLLNEKVRCIIGQVYELMIMFKTRVSEFNNRLYKTEFNNFLETCR